MKLDGDGHFPAKEEIQTPSSWEGGAPMKWQSDATNKKPSIRRTILVAALVSLIIGALTTFTAFKVTSHQTSSPLAALTAPLDNDHPGIPKEYVKQVLAYFSENRNLLNSTRHLEKRQAAQSHPHKCDPGDKFVTRTCDFSKGSLQYWKDTCMKGKTEYFVSGKCPEIGDWCSEHLDGPSLWSVVVCRPLVSGNVQITKADRKGGQYGYSAIKVTQDPHGHKYTIDIGVQVNLGAATISGYLTNEAGDMLVKPRDQLVAHIRGFDYEFCKNYGTGDECTPRGKRDLRINDVVDFTFALNKGHVAQLFYSFWGWDG